MIIIRPLSSALTAAFIITPFYLVLAACSPSPKDNMQNNDVSQAAPAREQLRDVAAVDRINNYDTWSCPAEPGKAPAGDLVAERIPAANNMRKKSGLYEGPVWLNGALYFSDFTFAKGFPSRIRRLVDDTRLETFIANSGSNGLAVDADGFLIAATHNTKSLSRFHPVTGERSNIVGMYEGNVFNSPNDLTEANDGSVYFTDPAFQRDAAPGGQKKTQVFRVAPDGVVSLVDDTIKNPNGISLSPAQDILYVAGGGDKGFVRAYPIMNGVPGEGKNLIEGIRMPDGMAIDCLGNLYVTEHPLKRLRVFSPAGQHLATIKVDANITNAAFGGPDRKRLYLTGAGAVWAIDLDVAGFPY